MQQDKHPLQEGQKYFCFLIIRTIFACIFGYFYLVANLCFFVCIVIQIYRLSKRGLFQKISLSIRILFFWSILSIIQISYFQGVYHYLQNNGNTDQQKSTISLSQFIITFLEVFIIHTALILAPYNWHSNIVAFMQQQSKIFQDQQQKIDIRENLQYSLDWMIRNLLHKYMIIRVFLLSSWIIILFVFLFVNQQDQQYRSTLASITYQLALVDVLIILMIYIVGGIAIHKNKKLKGIIQKNQLSKVLRKYFIVIISTFVRAIIFILRNPEAKIFRGQFLTENCTNQNQQNEIVPYNIFIVVEALVMDFLPAITIFIIYRVPKVQIEKAQSEILLNQPQEKI